MLLIKGFPFQVFARDMRYPPALLDEIRRRLPVSQVAARRVKLRRQGREYVGLSPFKHEKTPSFTVNDAKGFYHCFASGEHGDIFTFVMKTEGLSFAEAVERLAKEVGVALPKPEPRQAEKEAEFDRLRRITEASAAFFEAQLQGAAGREARDYLARRGVTAEETTAFRLGYAPQSRHALKQHLAGLGFSPEEAARAGMLISGEDIAEPYDRFRHRLMFPITNLSGSVIAFGGRALAADQQPKYLNSPETPLFHKGAVLFNAATARKAAYERNEIIVVEGYMDVIALTRAGFPNAVAPLGTALTDEQLRLLWRMAAEPVLCFDGDDAGRKAAARALDIALPHVKPGVSLRFAFLPHGLDPDDLVRLSGAKAMQDIIADARPLIDMLWAHETAAGAWATPEARAALDARLKMRADSIQDATVRQHYARELRARAWALWSPPSHFKSSSGRNSGFRKPQRRDARQIAGRSGAMAALAGMGEAASESLRNSALLKTGNRAPPHREALLLQTLLNHPWLIDEEAEAIAQIQFEHSVLGALRDAIININALQNPLDKEALRNQLTRRGLGAVLAQVEHAITHQSDWHTRPGAPRASVLIGWRHMMALHRKSSELRREIEAAEEAYRQEQTDGNFLKLRDLYLQLQASEGSEASIEGYAMQPARQQN